MKVIFYFKCVKFYVDFKKATTIWQNIDGFEDNYTWNCSWNLSQFWREYMWLAVKVLKSIPEISRLTKRDFFQLKLSDINIKVGKSYCLGGLDSVWELLTRWLPKGVVKEELSDIQVTTIFGGNKFQNNWAVKLIFFFSKCVQFYVDFKNAVKICHNGNGFEDNCIWSCCRNFSQFWGEYMW